MMAAERKNLLIGENLYHKTDEMRKKALIVNGIIYDARRIKAYEGMGALGSYAGKSEEFVSKLWEALVFDEAMMKEWMYYLDHHALLDEVVCEGYSLTDLYVWQMKHYNLVQDIGKNMADCNKEALVLDTFAAMLCMKKEPGPYKKRLEEGRGMDRF